MTDILLAAPALTQWPICVQKANPRYMTAEDAQDVQRCQVVHMVLKMFTVMH